MANGLELPRFGWFFVASKHFIRTVGKCLPFFSQSSICFMKKKAFLDVQFFRSETNMKDLNISVNKHEKCGHVAGKMVELVKLKTIYVFFGKAWWLLEWNHDEMHGKLVLIIDSYHSGSTGYTSTQGYWECIWRMTSAGTWGGNMRTATLACEKENWSGLKFSKKGYIYFSYIYNEFAIPKGGLVSNLGWTFF